VNSSHAPIEQRLQQLSIEQEKEITADVKLTLVAVCVLNRWTMNDILSYYHISENECVRQLAKLDRLKVIELLPGNRIRLLVAPNFSWRELHFCVRRFPKRRDKYQLLL